MLTALYNINTTDQTYAELSNYYEEYLEFGGFPEVVISPAVEAKKQLLSDAFSTYINQDVLTLSDFRSTTDLRKLISLLVPRIGNRMNVAELSEVSGISRPTISNYLEFLEQTYLIRTLPIESTSEDVKVRNLKKLYFVDNGIASINGDLSGGQKFENALCGQLTQYGTLSYYDNGRQEIDFILRPQDNPETLRGFGAPIALESKETPTSMDLSSLQFTVREKLKIQHLALVGHQKSEKFSNYIWGGEIA